MLTALLPTLVDSFPCFAVVRNPLSILGSWTSVNHHARLGHSPAAERYDTVLEKQLASMDDRIGRQLHLLSWWFDKLSRTLSDERVVRYEAIVESGGKALSAIVPEAASLNERLESRNLNAVYNRDQLRRLGRRLLESEGAYWYFYSREDVEELLRQLD